MIQFSFLYFKLLLIFVSKPFYKKAFTLLGKPAVRIEPMAPILSCLVKFSPSGLNFYDFIFKLIFGNEKHPEILISFLNAVIKPINKIVSVKIDNTELEKKITFIMSIGFKFIY
jgi:hypothetical protein